ncbi:MAG: hypothetical protein ABSF92_05350 [Candidatus Acidiferrales bacterium]|jgi:hypothetical protein
MDIKEATQNAREILDEERIAPTVHYVPSPPREQKDLPKTMAALAGYLNIHQMRQQHPRNVLEDPTMFTFESTNHELLRTLLAQISPKDLPQFLTYIGLRLVWGVGATRSNSPVYPKWNSLVSDSPLVSEFLVRNGGKAHLTGMLENEKTPIIPGHILLLLQLEDLIAFNYSRFTSTEYEQLSSVISKFGKRAANQAQDFRKRNINDLQWPEIGRVSASGLCHAIERSCLGIAEQCRKAHYFYLKGTLQQGWNLEVNQDKTTVETYLHQFGFSPSLIETLNEAERLYHSQGTPFDSKSSLGHLRSFLENVQKEAMPAIHAKYGGDLRPDWGGGLAYLAKNEILSKPEEQLAVGLYRLISDEGVHPLIAQREYVRLARNMVIEYSLLLLTKVEKLGFMVTARKQP